MHRLQKKAIELQKAGAQTMELDFSDPLKRFKDVFNLLLSPKELAEVDVNSPQLRYIIDGQTLGIESLSSGEKEVFSIGFDLLLREPEDCVIFFDEPELHLHPELSFRLLKTLQTIGARNQFIFCTHSSDIVSGSIEHSIVFISPRPKGENQGVLIRATDDSVGALAELGQSLGVISLGRKIVLIEGTETSIDRDTYGAVLQGRYPSLVLTPSGSRQTILSFARVTEDVLEKTLWGIQFYMLADRDSSLPDNLIEDLEKRSKQRLRFLPRYHIENYFLDEETIAMAFSDLAQEDSWLRDPERIRTCLKNLAQDCIPVAVNLWLGARVRSLIGEVDISLKKIMGKTHDDLAAMLSPRLEEEKRRLQPCLELDRVRGQMTDRWQQLEKSLESQEWRILFPGKVLVGQFCSTAKIDKGYFRNLYVIIGFTSVYFLVILFFDNQGGRHDSYR